MTSLTDFLPLRVGRAQRTGVRPGAVLAIVLTGQLMAVLDATIVNVAVPSMHADLHASGANWDKFGKTGHGIKCVPYLILVPRACLSWY